MTDPIRVFIASTPSEWLPARVLECSIRETTSANVEVAQLHTFNRPIPMPCHPESRPRTPFSFQRFLIPELCEWRGQALYLDADMQVFRDINALWTCPMRGCDVQTVAAGNSGRRGQFSVMLLDCAALKWQVEAIVDALDARRLTYEQLMYEMRVARQIGRHLPAEWNSLEHYEAGQTALLHYTDMNTQPWVSRANPLEPIWMRGLMRALENGFISMREVRREADSGHVRPSLVTQLEQGIDRSASLGETAVQIDQAFVAPYRALKVAQAARPKQSFGRFLSAVRGRLHRVLYGERSNPT